MALCNLFFNHSMIERKPSVHRLNEQLLRLDHLKQLPDLVEEILSTVQSCNTQMEFEERQYYLLQERQLIVNEKIVNAYQIQSKNADNEKKIAILLNTKQSPLAGLTEVGDKLKLTQFQQQLLLINRLYDKLTERISLFEKKIERCIATEIHHYEGISREGTKYAEIKIEQLRNMAKRRFELCIERITFIRKSEEKRLNNK